MGNSRDWPATFGDWTRVAAGWLCLAGIATALNSLLNFSAGRVIDFVVGLSLTQVNDAVFVGMALEPKGAPWIWTAFPAFVFDVPLIVLLFILAIKVLHRRRWAAQASFWVYAVDTFVFLAMFAANVILHAPAGTVVLSGLTVIGHGVGLLILFRAWRQLARAR